MEIRGFDGSRVPYSTDREFEPEPPTWRAGDWPIAGGPGKGIKRLLDAQRRRQRPGLDRE